MRAICMAALLALVIPVLTACGFEPMSVPDLAAFGPVPAWSPARRASSRFSSHDRGRPDGVGSGSVNLTFPWNRALTVLLTIMTPARNEEASRALSSGE